LESTELCIPELAGSASAGPNAPRRSKALSVMTPEKVTATGEAAATPDRGDVVR
jgi:hypothetical protein